jgi:hypothetical protein
MHQQRFGARAEYRQLEDQRVKDSASLAKKFQKLKSLKVELSYYNPDGATKSSHIKYSVNLENAKSIFRFSCPNNECVRGDFDLTKKLAAAVAARRKIVAGEMVCQGWRNRTTIKTARCLNILHYKLTLSY